jgi:glycosyltransferase involved in cell wall biosynthesis
LPSLAISASMVAVARILITGFCAVPGPSRSGVQLRHVVRALSSEHTVDLLVVRDGDQAYVERQGNVRILRVPIHDADRRAQVQSFQRALRRQLDGADYDVVHCRDGWSGRTVLDARATFGYAVVFDLSRGPAVDPVVDPALAAEIDRDGDGCIAEADLVLVPTEPARRYAIARTRADRVVVSPPGVDVDRFDWEDDPFEGPPRVLYAGMIEPGRGIRTLLRAIADVARQLPVRLVLTGPVAPGFAEPLAVAIRDLGLGDLVDVTPPVDHDAMPIVIAGATVCVAPEAPELVPRATALYPTKLLEYMACRRAVVAPRRATVAMLIDHGREGMLFQPGDPGDLTRKLLRLLQDAALCSRMAHHGYERVRRELTAAGARRAVRAGYRQLGGRPQLRTRFDRGAGPLRLQPELIDDDFEATVFEAPTGDDAALDSAPSLDVALEAFDPDGRTGDNPVTEERELAAEETAERAIDLDGRSLRPALPRVEGEPDDWIVRTPTGQRRARSGAAGPRPVADEDGTPVDVAAAPLVPDGPPPFIAGEIDVPTPPPEVAIEEDGAFTAASRLLGPRDAGPGPGARKEPC